jgi:hypothetical protein
MFSYAPQESDQSGRIIAQGMMGAAQTNAQSMGQLGQDIGGALAGIGQMYGAIEERKAKGRAFKKTMEVMGPSLGMTTDKLKAAFGDVKTDMDYANLSDSLMPIMPSWINSTLASGRMGIQQNAPILNAGLQGAARVAGGEGTVPLPEEPPIPAMDNAQLPPSQPSQPSPDVMSAADSWYNQSNRGMMQTGTMKPFYRK